MSKGCNKKQRTHLTTKEIAAKNAASRIRRMKKLQKVLKQQPNNYSAQRALNELKIGWQDGSRK